MDSNTSSQWQDWLMDSDVTEMSGFANLNLDDDIAPTEKQQRENTIISDTSYDVTRSTDENLQNADLCDITDEEEESIDVNPVDGLPYSSLFYQLLEKRKRLPVWKAKDDFVIAVDESPVVLVTGRPGTGKSTQIPHWCIQFARESNFAFGTVVSAQPSALAAMSLAIQVSQEMDLTEVGAEVGYRIPQADCTSEITNLVFCTDDILLREMALDPLLRKYSFIILDEVQERNVASDVLLALFKLTMGTRDDLKVIIISLYHEMRKLEDFFEEVPVIDLHFLDDFGEEKCREWKLKEQEEVLSEERERERFEKAEQTRINSKNIIYLPTSQLSLVKHVVDHVVTFHCNQDLDGDFLIFLPTSSDIEEACERIARAVAIKSLHSEAGELSVIPLHKNQTPGIQQAVYDVKPQPSCQSLKQRRVIISDEIAESSFSMANIKIVIDSGIVEEEVYNCRTRTRSRIKKLISRTSANLRSCRCSSEGSIYRMYAESDYKAMIQHHSPPIKRMELTSHILLLKRLLQRFSLNFSDCHFLDSPDPEAYMLALEELDYHGALDDKGNLSDLGAVMSEFDLSLPHIKCVIASCGEDCVQEILSIVAMASSPSCLATPLGFEQEATLLQRQMMHKSGDHFMLMNIYDQFVRHKGSEAWCVKNYINYSSVMMADKKRAEILQVMERLELPISNRITDPQTLETNVTRALLAGYFMQIARRIDDCGNYVIVRDKHVTRIHPQSCLTIAPEWILYNEFLLTQDCNVITVTSIKAQHVAEISPHSYLMNLPDSESKTLLLKLSSRWRQLHDNLTKPEVRNLPRRQNINRTGDSLSHYDASDDVTTRYGAAGKKLSSVPDKEAGDSDVLNQAAQGIAYAYQQAADYMGREEGPDTQCTIQ